MTADDLKALLLQRDRLARYIEAQREAMTADERATWTALHNISRSMHLLAETFLPSAARFPRCFGLITEFYRGLKRRLDAAGAPQ